MTTVRREPDWASDVPPNVLETVVARLYPSEWADFRATCKNWRDRLDEWCSHLRPRTAAVHLLRFPRLRKLNLRWMEADGARSYHLARSPRGLRVLAMRPDTVRHFFSGCGTDATTPVHRLEVLTIAPLHDQRPCEGHDLTLSMLPTSLLRLDLQHCGAWMRRDPAPLRGLSHLSGLTALSLRSTFPIGFQLFNLGEDGHLHAVLADTESMSKLQGLETLNTLRSLDVSRNRIIGVRELCIVGQLDGLTYIDLRMVNSIDVDGVKSLRPLKGLITLLMTDTPWTGAAGDMREVAEFSRLQRLDLPETNFTSLVPQEVTRAVGGIARLRDLRELRLHEGLFRALVRFCPDATLVVAKAVVFADDLTTPGRRRGCAWSSDALATAFPVLKTFSLRRVRRIRVCDVTTLAALVQRNVVVTVLGLYGDCTESVFHEASAPGLTPQTVLAVS